MKGYGRLFLLGAIAVLVVLFFITGLHRHLSLHWLKAQQAFLLELYAQRPFFLVAAFSAVYIPVVALNLPGAVVLGLAAGALFGPLAGTIIVSFTSSIGATLACLLSRTLLRNLVQRRFGDRLRLVNDGMREEGAFYLFALRLMPVIPFFIINLVMGLTSMRLRTFYLVSQLGMLPGTALFVHAGSRLGRVDSLSGILSPGVLLSLALLGIFPLAVRRCMAGYRQRSRRGADRSKSPSLFPADSVRLMASCLQTIRENCTDCGDCRKACAFLSHYGSPKRIAHDFDFALAPGQAITYECSLCGLCTAVCSEQLDPARLFLEVRRRCVADGNFDPSPYRAILGYEKLGVSPLFSWYGLPAGCDTVFFPGCSLPGTRPAVTMKMYRQLRDLIPGLGLVLDCCAKPSHDLGRTDRFQNLFSKMHDCLADQGIRTVLTACPSCTKIFRQYGQGLRVRTVYETLHEHGCGSASQEAGIAAGVHDPCALRGDLVTQQAVRGLLSGMGHSLVEMNHRHQQTLCCGEGGTVGAVNPKFAGAWVESCGWAAGGKTMITYCAGCTATLNRAFPTIHIADLLYRPAAALQGKLTIARAPLTYWNRLRLKQRMKKEIPGRVGR
jgi:uncharacterized membrane protein YdjX (TVP38/TMEM64 family)/Fe-S oxidoreductase